MITKKVKKMMLIVLTIGLMFYLLQGLSYEVKALGASDYEIMSSDLVLVSGIVNSPLGNFGRTIIACMQVAGTGISVIVVTFLGIKYMCASVESKAEVKKEMMPVLIGMALLFGAVNLVGIAADLITAMFTSG